ncbi:dienelactone hydrolase family protein [Micromonospora sp. DT81.3]|uniref:dienelactone hydrolase family protein n=1 Tax=Actinomycetes TaxID=1760 RepID=UPI003CF84E25
MDELESWAPLDVTHGGETRQVFRKGRGPGVIVLHEIPGIEPDLVAFAEQIVARGYTVLLPRLFELGGGFSPAGIASTARQFCVRREFSVFARGRTSPIAGWLRALARDLHADTGGKGIGVIGMCFTGGFALAMMADAPVIAPVVAEPSLPAAVGLPRGAALRGADLGLDSQDLDAVRASGCDVLGLRYRTDAATGTRFDTLRRELGDRFLAVEFEGAGHSVLTLHRREFAVHEVLAFLDRALLSSVVREQPERDGTLESVLEARLPPGFTARITRDPYRVVLFVDRGLTESGRRRVEGIARDETGLTPEIVRLTPRRQDITAESTA